MSRKYACILICNISGFLLISSAVSAQNLLRMPESVVYDSLHDRYLASNYSTGHIVSIDRQGNQQYFVQSQYCRNGLHIERNIVWAACIEQGVKGFDLDTGALVTHVVIDGAVNLNDITSDTSGNLYVSDVYAHRIYKIRLADYDYSTFIESGISYPNGIYFQKRYNRMLLVSLIVNSPIQAVSVEDSSAVYLVYTGRHNLDGITEDNDGNIYFSSWATTSVYVYDSMLTNPPRFLYNNAGGPADIFYDKINAVLAVPVMYTNSVIFISTPTAIGENDTGSLPDQMELGPIYPNPFNSETSIIVNLKMPGDIMLAVYDIGGRSVLVLADGFRGPGSYNMVFDGSNFSSGVYLVNLEANGFSCSQKMILLK